MNERSADVAFLAGYVVASCLFSCFVSFSPRYAFPIFSIGITRAIGPGRPLLLFFLLFSFCSPHAGATHHRNEIYFLLSLAPFRSSRGPVTERASEITAACVYVYAASTQSRLSRATERTQSGPELAFPIAHTHTRGSKTGL